MRIITAEVINKMSSPEGETREFDVLWQQKLQQLNDDFEKIREELPKSAVYLFEKVDLAGGYVQSRSRNHMTEESFFVIDKFQDSSIYFLGYDFVGEPEVDFLIGSGFAPDEPAVWLYDEFHKKRNFFEHHVVFSDGMSCVVPFKSLYLRRTQYFEENIE